MIERIYIMSKDIQVFEECCQLCQKLFVDAMLDKSGTGEVEGGTSKLTVNLIMCMGIF